MVIERELIVVVLFELMDLLEGVVVCLFMILPRVLCELLEDGLRTTGVLTERRVLIEPRGILDDILGRERIDRLEVLRLDVIDLERLGIELRVEILGALLRLEVLGAMDRFGLRGLEIRGCEREAAAVRLLTLLLELPLFRELLAAKTGSAVSVKVKMQKANIKEVIPARRDSTVLIFDL